MFRFLNSITIATNGMLGLIPLSKSKITNPKLFNTMATRPMVGTPAWRLRAEPATDDAMTILRGGNYAIRRDRTICKKYAMLCNIMGNIFWSTGGTKKCWSEKNNTFSKFSCNPILNCMTCRHNRTRKSNDVDIAISFAGILRFLVMKKN